MEKDETYEFALHNDAISAFNMELYSNIFTEENIVSREKCVTFNKEKFYGFFLEKGKESYFAVSSHIKELPFKVTKFETTDYKGDVFKAITEITSIKIPAEKKLSFRELIDVLCRFKHTNKRHQLLYAITAASAYIDRVNFRVSTDAGFGKDSVVNVISQLVDSTVNLYGATFAKLEYVLLNKLIVLNELGNLKKDELINMQEFLLAVGAYFNTYTKRTRKCYDEQTRVLTKQGFKYHNKVKKGEEILVVNPKTREYSWSVPKSLFQTSVINEDMIHFKSARGVDMCVTPEHKIWYTTNASGNWKEGKAKDTLKYKRRVIFDNYVKESPQKIILPTIKTERVNKTTWKETNNDEIELPLNPFLELLGWIITEGSIDKDGVRVRISQQVGRNANRIEKLIDELNFKCYKYVSIDKRGENKKHIVHFQIKSKWFNQWLRKNVGHYSGDKRIPDFIRNLSSDKLRIIFNAMINGDGYKHKKGTGITYYSKNYKLCEDVMEIAMKLGYNAHILLTSGVPRVMISEKTTKSLEINTNVKQLKYTGKIYCFETETGYYITERNGCLSFQGNTNTTQEQYDISKLSLILFYNLPSYYTSKAQEYFDQMFTKAVINRFIPFVFEGRLTSSFEKIMNPQRIMEANRGLYKNMIATFNWYRQNPLTSMKFITPKEIIFPEQLMRYDRSFNTILKYVAEYSTCQEEFNDLSIELYKCYKKYATLLVTEKNKVIK